MPAISEVGKRRLLMTGLRMATATVLLLVIYAVAPIGNHPNESIIVRLTIALFIFAAVLAWELRAIVTHNFPQLRALSALAVILPLFLVTFAWVYLTASISQPDLFNVPLTRTSAFYFTVTVFTTVGFGDITPKSSLGQMVVTVQMLLNLALIAVGIRAIFGAASVGEARRQDQPTGSEPKPGGGVASG